MLEDNDLSSSTMDESDIRAFKEQISQLSLQLEGSFRELDRQKRDHDIEVSYYFELSSLNCVIYLVLIDFKDKA